MRKTIYLFALLLLCPAFLLLGQPYRSADNIVKEEQEKFIRDIKRFAIDSSVAFSISDYFDGVVEAIHMSWEVDPKLSVDDKEKAARSFVFFMKELNRSLDAQKIYLCEIPSVLKAYETILTAILYHKPIKKFTTSLDPRHSQLLAEAFSQYKEYTFLDDITVYKRMAASPEFILQFLEKKPGFRFADSLLLSAATHDPLKMAYYLNEHKQGIQGRIRESGNVYLQQLVTLSKDKFSSELLPFIQPIADKDIQAEEILEKRKDAAAYFQLLVNTLQSPGYANDRDLIFLKPLRNGIRQKSLSFYVNEINDLHSSSDDIRFASVKGLRPQDLYYIITSSGDELYTSSYLGLYKRLIATLPATSSDSLFDIVQYDNFRIFMRLAANYNVLVDFLQRMPRERMERLLKQFIGDIDTDAALGLEKAMDIADCFAALGAAPDIINLVEQELETNHARCKSERNYVGLRLYTILLQVFELVKPKNDIRKLWSTLGNYEELKQNALRNKGKEIVQLVLFYGDDDGVASFSNFLKQYADTSKWRIIKNENWIGIRSRPDSSLHIYANRPLDSEQDMDLKAQDSLFAFLGRQSMEPAILIHRGHSYHLSKTLKRLTPSIKLAILGSCGGYNKAISIAGISPAVQVIGSKKTGSMSINDPIIEVINETLVSKNDLLWSEVWKKLGDRFSKDAAALTLFNEYFPPSGNLSLFVLKLFKYHN